MLFRYGVPLLSTLCALLATTLLWPLIAPAADPLFLAAVMFSAWSGGLGPGLLATALSMLCTNYFFSDPAHSILDDLFRSIIFALVSIFISWLSHTRRLSEARIQASLEEKEALLREKEVLLKEIHHRVKNNLQTIVGLLNLQANVVDDPRVRGAFQESQSRIQSMSLIHQTLYQSNDLARLDVASYLGRLTHQIFASYGVNPRTVTLQVDAEDVPLSIDTAIPCGLIVNELLTNALKYAFPDGRSGRVRVSLHRTPSLETRVSVSDDGVGLPADFDLEESGSLGLQLVHELTRQIGGRLEIARERGTCFMVTFSDGAGHEHVEREQGAPVSEQRS